MNFFGRQKRKVPKPETIGSHQAANPLFAASERSHEFRRRVLGSTAGICFLLALGLLIEGPWWRINSVTVAGVREIDPKSVQHVTEQYVMGRRLLVIPNQNLFLFSTAHAASWLREKIEQRISVESVTVQKIPPHGLHVTITERTPAAYARSEDQTVVLDRTGKIIEVAKALDPNLPVIDEAIGQPVGQSVFSPAVMQSILKLHELLRSASIVIVSWKLPIVTCPVYENPQPPTDSRNTNLNANIRLNPFSQTCNDQALKRTRPEIHVQIKDGPEARFDRFQDLAAAVQRVRRILAQPDPPNEYIDVRFGDRVFVK